MTSIINILASESALGFCNSYNVLIVFYFIKKLLTLLSIIVPIILIVIATVDAIKVIISGNADQELKGLTSKLVKRLIFCFIFFLLPTVINLVFNIIGFANYELSDCWKNSNENAIKALKDQKDNEAKQEEDDVKNSVLESEKNEN